MTERNLKLTELDYVTADHHLQMLKAAIPYLERSKQRTLSMFVKIRELNKIKDFFDDHDLGMLSICELDKEHAAPADMLRAVKPYANPKEQEMIDMMEKLLSSRSSRQGVPSLSFEQLRSLLPQEQQTRLETLQLMMQTLGQI